MINECALRPDICGNGKCIDTRDGYECDCYSGFTKKAGRCEDIDECLLGYCEGGTCQNYEGSYTCQCPPGFVVAGEGRYCTGEKFKEIHEKRGERSNWKIVRFNSRVVSSFLIFVVYVMKLLNFIDSSLYKISFNF